MRTLILCSFLSSVAFAKCPRGTEEFGGNCASMPSPEENTLAPAIGIVNDEKPSRHPEPAYLRGEVHADIRLLFIRLLIGHAQQKF